MQTVLILFAFEVHAAKLQNFPIVPPEEATYYKVDGIPHEDQTPKRASPDIRRC